MLGSTAFGRDRIVAADEAAPPSSDAVRIAHLAAACRSPVLGLHRSAERFDLTDNGIDTLHDGQHLARRSTEKPLSRLGETGKLADLAVRSS